MRIFPRFHHWNLVVLGLLFVTMTGCRVWNRTHVTSAGTLASRQYVQQAARSLEQNNEEDAEVQLSEALDSNPANTEARVMMAEILWKKGKQKEATAEMERVAASVEAAPEHVTRLAQMYFDQGNFQDAQKWVSTSFRFNDSLSATWVLQGEIYEKQARNEDALASYHQAAFYAPEDSKIQLKIASIYLRIGKPQRALETAQNARLKGLAEDASAEMLLCESKALAELNRSTDARRLLMIAYQKDPENTEIQTALAQLQPIQSPTLVDPETRYGSEIKILPKPEKTDH